MRAALVSGDGDRIVAAMAGVDLESWAQQVGSGLLAAIENGSEKVRPIARHCADVLRGRRWDGDEELADDLESALDPESSGLRLPALLVDLDEVAGLLDSGNGDGGWIDLVNGDTWNRDMLDALDEFDNNRPDFDYDSDRWLAVPSLGGRAAYRDMQDFVSAVTGPAASERLTVAGRRQWCLPAVQRCPPRLPGPRGRLVPVLWGTPARSSTCLARPCRLPTEAAGVLASDLMPALGPPRA